MKIQVIQKLDDNKIEITGASEEEKKALLLWFNKPCCIVSNRQLWIGDGGHTKDEYTEEFWNALLFARENYPENKNCYLLYINGSLNPNQFTLK